MGSAFEDRRWLARVLDRGGVIVGAAFAIGGGRLLTCAHVAQDAGAMGPGDLVRVDFVALGVGYDAVVLADGWAPVDGTSGDVAVLELQDGLQRVRPAPLRALYSLDGQASSACGFPAGYDDGMWTKSTLGLGVGRAWVQLEVTSPNAVERGFSGAAVWSVEHGAVVAMMVTRDTKTGGRVAFAISIATLTMLFSPLELDAETSTHWGPRSRGVSSDMDSAGWMFSGRGRALSELVSWLTNASGVSVRVVTGMPGTGKSAVLARVVTTADRRYRNRIPNLADEDPEVAPAGVINVTFHAKDQTVTGFVEHVAAVLGLSLAASTAGALSDAVREGQRRPVVAVDAIDESTEPRALCALLNALGGLGCRVLAGCREHLLTALSDPDPLRLDQSPYLQPGDIEAYVAAILREHGADTRASDLVAQISDAAQGNFLVAQLVARAVTISGRVVKPLPRDVAQAFEGLLEALPRPTQTRELLLALAYAKGDGLPIDLWRSAASVLSRPCQRADIDALLRGPAASFLITRVDDPTGARHRLFHEALAETLTRDRDANNDQVLLWDAWRVAGGEQAMRWHKAPAYVLVHGAEHAAAAGALDALVMDTSYLLHADLTRLLVQLADKDHATHTRVLEVAAILRLAAARLQPMGPRDRGDLLALTACHLGLPTLTTAPLEVGQSRWRARWAHRLGDPHQPLSGHRGSVNAVAIAAVSGRTVIASASFDRTVRLWDAATGEPIREPIRGHSSSVTGVAIGSSNGRAIIVSCSRDRTVRVWDALTSAAIGAPLTGHTKSVNGVAIGSASGRTIIASAGDDQTVRIWDAATGKALHEPLTGHTSPITAVAVGVAAERVIVASAGSDRRVRLWDAATGEPIGKRIRHGSSVTGVAIGSSNGRAIIVSCSRDRTVRVWDVLTGEAIGPPLMGHTKSVNGVAIGSASGRTIIASAGDDQTVRIWDAATGKAVLEPRTGHTNLITAVAVGVAAERTIVASASWDATVRIWEAGDAKTLGRPLIGHTSRVVAIAQGTAEGHAIVASASDDQTVRVWDSVTGEPFGEEEAARTNDRVTTLATGPGGQPIAAVADYDLALRAWDVVSGEPLGPPLMGHTRPVTALAAGTADGHAIMASTDHDLGVRVWDMVTGEPLGSPLIGHTRPVVALAIGMASCHPIIATASDDLAIRVWYALTGHPAGEPLIGHDDWITDVTIGIAGGRAIVASASDDRTVRLWDPLSGKAIGAPLTGHTSSVTAVAIGNSSDGVLASSSLDGTVRVWDAQTREMLQLIHLLDEPWAIAFGPAGVLFVAVGRAICRFELEFVHRDAARHRSSGHVLDSGKLE